MSEHHSSKTYLRPVSPEVWEMYDEADGATCPSCGGLHKTVIENQYGANSIIWGCIDCGLQYRMEYKITNVYISNEDVVNLAEAVRKEFMVFDGVAVERQLHKRGDT